ncbi:MAG: acyltransferase family protein, partial [Geminicoccaceae bacterium]
MNKPASLMLADVMRMFLSIQYLRALAAMAVIWCHTYVQLGEMTGSTTESWFNGRSGVDLFFVVSGFIIWLTTYDRRIGPIEFWRLRMIRIVPLYWLATFAFVILLFSAPSLFDRLHLDFGHVVRSLMFIPHFDPFQPDLIYPLLEVGWTLNFEMFFYAVFGLCLVFRPAGRILAIGMVFAVLLVIGALLNLEHAVFITYSDPLLLEFIA